MDTKYSDYESFLDFCLTSAKEEYEKQCNNQIKYFQNQKINEIRDLKMKHQLEVDGLNDKFKQKELKWKSDKSELKIYYEEKIEKATKDSKQKLDILVSENKKLKEELKRENNDKLNIQAQYDIRVIELGKKIDQLTKENQIRSSYFQSQMNEKMEEFEIRISDAVSEFNDRINKLKRCNKELEKSYQSKITQKDEICKKLEHDVKIRNAAISELKERTEVIQKKFNEEIAEKDKRYDEYVENAKKVILSLKNENMEKLSSFNRLNVWQKLKIVFG